MAANIKADPINAAISLLGVPFDANSSFLRGPALAPRLIREALYSDSSNLWTEDGIDLGRTGAIHDVGDLELPESSIPAFAAIEAAVWRTLGLGHPLISLGGDHSITYPIIKGFRPRWPELTILHFDAHPDLYDELGGKKHSHACPFARIMEEKLARRLVQVGIRTMNGHQTEQAKKFGVEVITMRELERFADLKLEGPLYISFDVDVLDPAFAPGVSHYEPGGMSVREVLSCIQSLPGPLVGADIVEYNPTRDLHNQTAMVCAKVLKEIAATMMRRGKLPAEK
ncbi:MAG TPA: agmatinase family protein [Candidatus Angelobacter sp.]|nr:agmatinase family protein [Candidatus Angelobacter sp.]